MALKRNETYPGRFSNPTDEHPQGAFKNRTAPGAQDGSFLEQQWANDWDGFFGAMLDAAGIAPNGNVDTALVSQYFNALRKITLQRSNPFGDIASDGNSAVALARTNLGLGEAALVSLGVGQNWTNVTGQRQVGVTYTNTTGKPILVVPTAYAEATSPAVTRISIEVDGTEAGFNSSPALTGGQGSGSSVPTVVPNGSTYRVSNLIGLLRWSELR